MGSAARLRQLECVSGSESRFKPYETFPFHVYGHFTFLWAPTVTFSLSPAQAAARVSSVDASFCSLLGSRDFCLRLSLGVKTLGDRGGTVEAS